MAYLLAGPVVALLGIGAVFFVLRRKSEEKRSMYSARRQQIEHKVRAARQRTLAPHGHAPKPAEHPSAAGQPSPFEQAQQVQPTVAYEYQAPAYEAPPVAPPAPPPAQPAPASPMPWDTPAAPAPASSGWDFPPATAAPAPPAPEPFRPATEPTPVAPSEPVWTPAPRPAEPLAPAQTVASAASSTAAGSWEVVSSTKDAAATAAPKGKKDKKDKTAAATGSDWSLASGDAPGADAADEGEPRRPSGKIIAVAQYALMVVGLVAVLIGVLVMVANSHVT